MITKRYITNELREKLTENLKDEDFILLKSKERIMRKFDGGFDNIYIRVVDYNPIFEVEFSISIRLDVVEEMVYKFLDERFMNPRFNSLTPTIAASYKLLSGSVKNYITIKSETDLQNAIKDLTSLVKKNGFTFFKKYRDLQNVNQNKKENILKDNTGIAHILTNLMQSLILMKLCNDSDFKELSEKYKKLLVPWAGQEESGRKALDDLIHYLETR